MRKRVTVQGRTFELKANEYAELKAQLNVAPSKFVALGVGGKVVDEGDEVIEVERGPYGVRMVLRGPNATGGGWWYFGIDNYVIVTRKQYEALLKAGVAVEQDD